MGSKELLAASAQPHGCRAHGADLLWSQQSFLCCWHMAQTLGPTVAFGTLALLCPSVKPLAKPARCGQAWPGNGEPHVGVTVEGERSLSNPMMHQ